MPTYEYECRNCGLHFEKFQKMSDAPLDKCPECGGAVTRLIGTGAAVIFKGSGFYATDYKSSRPRTSCGRDRPCCGKDTPCDAKPCDD
jgi:putative FmdB family regulatory protein